jgi:hypothetical protein
MAGKQFTGIDGSLYADGARVAKIQNWTFGASAATLDCTTLGDFATRYVYGIQSFSGSCVLLYYENEAGAIDGNGLLTDVLRTTQTPTEPTHTMELRYENGAKLHAVSFSCLLNQVGISATAGGIVTAEVTFTVNGPLTTATID